MLHLVHAHRLPVEEVTVNLHLGEHRAPAFLALNPNGAVPVLVDDGFVLTESVAILTYLCRRFDLPAYPADPHAQAQVDEWTQWFMTNFRVMHCIFGVYPKILPELSWLDPATLRDLGAISAQGSARYLAVLDAALAKGGPYLCGATPTIADYVGTAQITLADQTGFDATPWPHVADWLAPMRDSKGWDAAYAGFAGLVRATRNRVAEPV